MDYKHNKEIVALAETLKKNMTKEEKLIDKYISVGFSFFGNIHRK